MILYEQLVTLVFVSLQPCARFEDITEQSAMLAVCVASTIVETFYKITRLVVPSAKF